MTDYSNAELVLLAGGAMVCLAFFLGAVKRVPAGEAWAVARGGEMARVLLPGFHLLAPFIDHVARRLRLEDGALTLRARHVQSGDGRMIVASGQASWRVEAVDKALAVDDLDRALKDRLAAELTTKARALTPDYFTSHPDRVTAELTRRVNAKAQHWGVALTAVTLDVRPG